MSGDHYTYKTLFNITNQVENIQLKYRKRLQKKAIQK